MDSVWIVVALGAMAAGFVQGLSGFGFGLTAMSLWAWVLEPRLAATLAVFGALLDRGLNGAIFYGSALTLALGVASAGLVGVGIAARSASGAQAAA